MTDQIKSEYKDLLNALYEMQNSPAYAVRKSVLMQAEQTIVALERVVNKLRERKVKYSQPPWAFTPAEFRKLYESEFPPDDKLDSCITFLRQATREQVQEAKKIKLFSNETFRNAIDFIEGE